MAVCCVCIYLHAFLACCVSILSSGVTLMGSVKPGSPHFVSYTLFDGTASKWLHCFDTICEIILRRAYNATDRIERQPSHNNIAGFGRGGTGREIVSSKNFRGVASLTPLLTKGIPKGFISNRSLGGEKLNSHPSERPARIYSSSRAFGLGVEHSSSTHLSV